MRHAAAVSITSSPICASTSARVSRGCGKRSARAGAQQHDVGPRVDERREVRLGQSLEAGGREAGGHRVGGQDQVLAVFGRRRCAPTPGRRR